MKNTVIFEADDQPVQVRLEGETVWLTQRQMAEIFTTWCGWWSTLCC